ncbi:arylesterase [Pseudoalteromonas rubra]|uniref:Arylesterase n=1 Tax=Pseudoalteromonas rubra TaxID=43658 RepID=A0A5S3WI38_9GAMM|nr:arylesterase [Pseudoalteromonas rubra]TMP26873.1 arylesterase [Pseudoalteromonas rubra]TMP33742.1 arylesterase [Pseudoalteromonas rubra]
MMRFFLQLVVLIFGTLFVLKANANDTKIMIIGDSLSAGYGLKQAPSWVNLLQNKYETEQKAITLINTSVSGQTTDNALLTIDKQLESHQPSHVLIELGANDGLRGFPPKLIRKHLRELVDKSLANGAKVALMQIQIPPNYGQRYSTLFADSYPLVAEQTGAYLMDYFMLPIAADRSLMQNDNLHPNEKAQPLIRDFMYERIAKWLATAAK